MSAAGTCDCPRAHFEGTTYGLCDEAKQWTDARELCGLEGGHLVIIDDDDENGFLHDEVRDADLGEPWIGLYESDVDTFTWIDGSAISYEAWAPGDPDGGGGKCARMNYQGTDAWGDRECNQQQTFICESGFIDSTN